MNNNGGSTSYAVPVILVAGGAALFLLSRNGKASKKTEKSLIPSNGNGSQSEDLSAQPGEILVSSDASKVEIGSNWENDILLPYLRRQWGRREIERFGLNPPGFGYRGEMGFGWDYIFDAEEPGILEVKHELRRDLYANHQGKQRPLAALPASGAISSLLGTVDSMVDDFVKSQIQRVHDQSWQAGS
jgi:hypothetical protein